SQNKEDFLKTFNTLIDEAISLSEVQQMDYVHSLAQIIKDSLNKGGKEDLIFHDLCKMWEFFYILIAIDSNELRQSFSLVINQGPEQRKDLLKVPQKFLIYKILLKVSKASDERDLNDFFDVIDALQIKVLKDLSPNQLIYEENLKEDINYAFYQLKQKIPFPNEEVIDTQIKSFFKLVKSICENNMPCSYHAKIDLLKFLRPYTGIDDDMEFSQKPQMTEVLIDNLKSCKRAISEYFDRPPKDFSLTIDRCFEKLQEEPIKYTLSKFKNVVSDVSKTLGKITTFNITGDQSSMSREKLVILQEALLHLIRNSLDHGLESPEERKYKGKSEKGLILIDITQKDSETKIILKDDGNGINIDQVARKALSQGIISQDDMRGLTNEQKIDLIFSPNLSTKEQVSEISGRGIGMDIVKKNIEKMGGKIKIKTALGQSTEFEITIPN
ncbi:MAG: ATP-binding protein, partial [Bdellovibrionota bacterium]|nr:ATP-binding protein [Bdellovibrionota bacterium]